MWSWDNANTISLGTYTSILAGVRSSGSPSALALDINRSFKFPSWMGIKWHFIGALRCIPNHKTKLNILYIYIFGHLCFLICIYKIPMHILAHFSSGLFVLFFWLVGLLCIFSKMISSWPVLFHLCSYLPFHKSYWSKF